MPTSWQCRNPLLDEYMAAAGMLRMPGMRQDWPAGGALARQNPQILQGCNCFYGYLNQKHAHNSYTDWLSSPNGAA